VDLNGNNPTVDPNGNNTQRVRHYQLRLRPGRDGERHRDLGAEYVRGADNSFVADLLVSGPGRAGGTLYVAGTWLAPGPVGDFTVSGQLGGLSGQLGGHPPPG
jgi:hypothetical protein